MIKKTMCMGAIMNLIVCSLIGLGILCACTTEFSVFQGAKWSIGSGSRPLANGKLTANWERSNENRLKIKGTIDFKLDTLYVRSFRNGTMQVEQIVRPDANGNFSADLDDQHFARVLCVEIACFDI